MDILRKFADDSKLCSTVSTPEERAALQQTLDNLCEWADNWGMEFNVKKCKVMSWEGEGGEQGKKKCNRKFFHFYMSYFSNSF